MVVYSFHLGTPVALGDEGQKKGIILEPGRNSNKDSTVTVLYLRSACREKNMKNAFFIKAGAVGDDTFCSGPHYFQMRWNT